MPFKKYIESRWLTRSEKERKKKSIKIHLDEIEDMKK